MSYGIRKVGARIEVIPELSEYIPSTIRLETASAVTKRTKGTRKQHAYTGADYTKNHGLVLPHDNMTLVAIREANETQRIPFTEYEPVLVIDASHDLANRFVLGNLDDIDSATDVTLEFEPTAAQGWIPADAVIVFRMECHAYNREGKRVVIYAGSTALRLCPELAGKQYTLPLKDISDPPASDQYPDFLAPGGTGFEKGILRVEFPANQFELHNYDFAAPTVQSFNKKRNEELVDKIILRDLANFLELEGMTNDYGTKPMRPIMEGIEPMQAPVYRTLVSKLPGGAWALLKHANPTPTEVWIKFFETALMRYSRMAVAWGTDLWHADIRAARHWYTETVRRQFDEWGPNENRVHPEFHLACMVTFHAMCIVDTSMYYTDDHTNENRSGTIMVKERVKLTNNQRLSIEEGSGDCDTFAGSINRFCVDLQNAESFDGDYVDVDFMRHAQEVLRLYVVGMPHGAVSTKNILQNPTDDLQNHMYAMGIPRFVFYRMLLESARHEHVVAKKLAPYYNQIMAAEARFGGERQPDSTFVSTYSSMPWQKHLQIMLLEGTGPLNPFALPGWLSACSWLYAGDPDSIDEETRANDEARAVEIARREEMVHELEMVLAKELKIYELGIGTSMMLSDQPTASIRDLAKAGWNASHFYKAAVGFQTSELADAGVPIIDFFFTTTTHGYGTVFGATYFDLITSPWQYAALSQKTDVAHVVRIRPSVFMTQQEFAVVEAGLALEPAPFPLETAEMTDREIEIFSNVKMVNSDKDCVETTYFVRIEDLPKLLDELERNPSSFITRVHARECVLGYSNVVPDMRYVVVDVTIGTAMPPRASIEEAIKIEADMETQLEDLVAVLTGTA